MNESNSNGNNNKLAGSLESNGQPTPKGRDYQNIGQESYGPNGESDVPTITGGGGGGHRTQVITSEA